MDKALRVFFKTGRELESLSLKASQARLPNVEELVCEFREILMYRAIAAEALEIYDSPKTLEIISELRALEQH
jgi:hypothetical protein